MLILDTATFERALFAGGHRHAMIDPHTSTPGNPKPRIHGSTLSLDNLLRSLPSPSDPQPQNPIVQTHVLVPGQFPQAGATLPGAVMHNSGNDAFMCLYALQLLLEPVGTPAPVVAPRKVAATGAWPLSFGFGPSSNTMPRLSPSGLVGDFAQMHMYVRQNSRSPGPMLPTPVQSPKHGNGNGNGNGNGAMARSSRRLSAVPNGDAGWSNVRRG
jgi:hypothetical protein